MGTLCVELVHALYSLPVCGASFFSTWPGLTCFRAGLGFFAGFVVVTAVSVFELIAAA